MSFPADRLSGRIDAVLRRHLGGAPAVALAMYPHHANVGDSAIWWGSTRALRRAGARMAYVCDHRTFDPRALRRALPEGPLLLLGGGNFGDVYRDERDLRERILREVRDRPVIQLPQSLWFRDPREADRLAALCADHPSFHLMVRDTRSRDFAARRLGLRATLCPDMAFALGDLSASRAAAETDVLVLARSDPESRGGEMRWTTDAGRRRERADWPMRWPEATRGWPRGLRLSWVRNQALRRLPGLGPEWLRRLTAAPWDDFAQERTLAGCRWLSRGRVLVTDRLHGHILAVLCGQPHVVFDTVNGKIRAFYETWTRRSGGRWADTADEAMEKAEALLIRSPNGRGAC